MKNEEVIACIKKELKTINDEMGELRDSQIVIRTNQEWIMKQVLPRLEKEVWAVLFLIVSGGLAFWFFK